MGSVAAHGGCPEEWLQSNNVDFVNSIVDVYGSRLKGIVATERINLVRVRDLLALGNRSYLQSFTHFLFVRPDDVFVGNSSRGHHPVPMKQSFDVQSACRTSPGLSIIRSAPESNNKWINGDTDYGA